MSKSSEVFVRRMWKGSTEVQVVNRLAPTFEGHIALKLIENWGLVACTDDGEDSSGRKKNRLLPPVEVAERACDIAEALMQQWRLREWLLDVPAPTNETKPSSEEA